MMSEKEAPITCVPHTENYLNLKYCNGVDSLNRRTYKEAPGSPQEAPRKPPGSPQEAIMGTSFCAIIDCPH